MKKYRVLLESILLLLVTWLISTGFAYLFFSILDIDSYDIKFTLFQAGVDISFVVAIIVALKIWKQKLTLKFVMPSEKTLWIVLLIAICLYIASKTFPIVYFYDLILKGKLKYFEFHLTERGWTDLLKAVVLAPIYEEVFYRRLIFKKIEGIFSFVA